MLLWVLLKACCSGGGDGGGRGGDGGGGDGGMMDGENESEMCSSFIRLLIEKLIACYFVIAARLIS